MSKGSYPKMVRFRNIKPALRMCCDCGKEIRSRGEFFILSLSPGKYVCSFCERKRRAQKEATEHG